MTNKSNQSLISFSLMVVLVIGTIQLQAQCVISNLNMTNVGCTATNTVEVDVCFDYANPISGNVEIFFDGASQGVFAYPLVSGDCITVSSSVLGSGAAIVVDVVDANSGNPIYISELHYDDESTDDDEFVEITGPVGTSLAGYTLEFYNGNGGVVYDTEILAGTIDDEGGACGALAFFVSGIQNGSPDGIALVDPTGAVLEFISYEGTVTATAGPAMGMTSVDLGVSEGNTGIGGSLSFDGTSWIADVAANTAGAVNAGVTCNPACEATATFTTPNCCDELVVDAYAFCVDANNPFIEDNYYIEVAVVTGGTNSGTYDITINSVVQTFAGTAVTFGPFAHSLTPVTVQNVAVVEVVSGCSASVEVLQTLCTDLSGNGAPDNSYVNCDCIASSQNNNGGTIFSQAAPGSFVAGGTSGLQQYYILTNQNSGTATILNANQTGYFLGVAAGTHYVYAINIDPSSAPTVAALLVTGASVDLAALIAGTGPYIDECYSACGPASYSVNCMTDASTIACNSHINVTVDSECNANRLAISQFVEGDIDNEDLYGLVITTQGGEVVDLLLETTTTSDDVFNYLGEDLIYSVTHACSSSTCWGYVTLEDKSPPQLDCNCPVGGDSGTYAPECTFSCYDISLLEGTDNLPADIANFVNNSIEDNCSNYEVSNVYFEDDLSDLGMCGGSVLRRTWFVSYKETGSLVEEVISCTREYSFEPLDLSTAIMTSGPVVNPQENTVYFPVRLSELSCTGDTSPAGIAKSGGAHLAYPHVYVNGEAVGIDGSLCNINAVYTDTTTDGCAVGCLGDSKIIRSWTVLDWCTSAIEEYRQVIKLVDDVAPILFVGTDIDTSTTSSSCLLNMSLPAPLALTDLCDENASYTVESTSGGHTISGNAAAGFSVAGLGIGSHEIYYSAQDCCGNTTADTLVINIKDNISPNAIAIEYIVVPVYGLPSGDEIFAKVSAESIDNGSFDQCSGVTLAIRREEGHCETADTQFGEKVHFCCEDMNEDGWGDVRIQLRVTDECGNTNTVWSLVRLQDKSSEELNCPAGLVIDCEQYANDYLDNLAVTGIPTSKGICGDISLVYDTTAILASTVPAMKSSNVEPAYDIDNDGSPDAIQAYDESCGFGALKREFADSTGVYCTQYFVVEPANAFDPQSIVWPTDIVSSCSGYNPVPPTYNSLSCGHLGVTVESDTFPSVEGACIAIVNTWTIVDWCAFDRSGGVVGLYTNTQEVKIIDDSSPVVNVENNMNFDLDGSDCTLDQVSINVSAMDNDNCPLVDLKWSINIDFYSDGSIDERISETSLAGDTFALQIAMVPASKLGHRIEYSVTDDCGNETVTTTTFTVSDKTLPNPYCASVTTSITDDGTFELWAVDYDAGATDNCTAQEDLRFTFTDQVPPTNPGYYNPQTGAQSTVTEYLAGTADNWNGTSGGRSFTEDDLDLAGFLTVSVYVWDECGNYDFCILDSQIRRVDEGRRPVQGSFITQGGKKIQAVQAELMTDVAGYPAIIQSDVEGAYAFSDNPMYKDYIIKGKKDDDYLNGVSTFDLIQIQRHILGQVMLDNPYKYIAADINNDRVLNGLDIVELRKLILGLYDAFPENDSWKFVDAKQQLTLDNPWVYRDSLTITNLEEAMMEENFIGVKIGDIDDSMITNVEGQGTNLREDNDIVFVYDDKFIEKGELIEVAFSTAVRDIYGYQLGLSFNGLRLINVEGRDLSNSNVFQVGNAVRISHNSDYIIDIESGFMTLSLKAEASGRLSEMIDLETSYTQPEGYIGQDLQIRRLRLASSEDSAFKLYQNRPNPFSGQTMIEYELPRAELVRMSFYDVTGKLLHVIEAAGKRGYNTLTLRQEDFGRTGVIYYKLECGDKMAMKHMIIVE